VGRAVLLGALRLFPARACPAYDPVKRPPLATSLLPTKKYLYMRIRIAILGFPFWSESFRRRPSRPRESSHWPPQWVVVVYATFAITTVPFRG